MEKRYGANLLNWLKYPAWTGHRPSSWIRTFYRPKERRTPTIVFLLFVGLFNSSVRAFETASTDESEDGRLCGRVFGIPEWKANLSQFLAIDSFELASVARRIGVSRETVATEARKQGIHVPLSERIARRLGQETLENIRSDLRAGMSKKEMYETHRLCERTIRLIELDMPGIADARKSAAARKRRDAHRQKVLDLIARDSNTSRSTIWKQWRGTYVFMLKCDREWFEKILPQPLWLKATTKSPQPCALDAEAVRSLDWTIELPRLLAAYSFKLVTLADRIGVSPNKVATEARKQGIRVPLSEQITRRLGQETLENIRSDLRAGLSKEEVQKKHQAGEWAVRLIELDTPGIADEWKSAAARKKRDAHRQKVLDLIACDSNTSRSTIQKTWPRIYDFMRKRDMDWFEKTLSRRPRSLRARKTNRWLEVDSMLAEKVREIISELKSTSHRPVWITKRCVLTRAECSWRYREDSNRFPRTEAVLREHVESRADYVIRRIRWAVAEMAARRQTISGKTLHREAGVGHSFLKEYKQLVFDTAQQLGAIVDPRSIFARDTNSQVLNEPTLVQIRF
jgi:hypothetical protein